VQNAHHFTETTPLTENSIPICGGLQEIHHHIEGTEITSPNFESADVIDSMEKKEIG